MKDGYVLRVLKISLLFCLISFGNYPVLANGHQTKSLELDKPTVLVTGSNRGIGFALVKNYAANAPVGTIWRSTGKRSVVRLRSRFLEGSKESRRCIRNPLSHITTSPICHRCA